MKFVCDRCQTKYSIADDKVRGKVLKVRCKTCQNVITVREAGAKPSVGSLAPVRPSQKPSTGPLATLGESHEEQSERTSIAPAPAGLMADMLAHQGKRPTPPPPPPVGDGIEWFLALDGVQQGPFTRKMLVDRLVAMPKDADVHVWNDGMDGWKPPKDVPDVAHDLAARRPPAVPMRPPVPRAAAAPPVPPPAASARRPSQPLATGAGKLSLPSPHAAAAHAVPGHAAHGPGLADSSAVTPPPASAPTNGHHKSNGHAAHAPMPTTAFSGESDALSALNLASGAAVAKAPATPPRIMEVADATAWSGQGRVQEGRHRNTKMVFGLLGVVCVIIVVVALNMTKKAPGGVLAAPVKAGLDSEALEKLHGLAQKEPPPKPPEVVKEEPGPDLTRGKGKGRGAIRGRPGARGVGNVAPGAFVGENPPPAGTGTGTPPPPGSLMPERAIKPLSPIANRPPPSQGEITRVIANNKIGIKTCYQRALLRDSSLTHGKIVVGVTIGISGRVKGVRVDGPVSFRTLEPCIKEMVGRWTFPQASEEYGTEFSYLFQGNE